MSPAGSPALPRLRQAVLAARDLDAAVARLRAGLGLGAPYADPAVEIFGLRNAVFALDDTFLEVVSPLRADAAAARLIERRGGDCGYMLMFQVEDVAAARARAGTLGIRAVFEVSLDDMTEAHLHPGDMRAAIVSLSAPDPPSAWRWGGPDWSARTAPLRLTGATVAVADADSVGRCWRTVLDGEVPGIELLTDADEPGVLEILLEGPQAASVAFERVRVVARPGVSSHV